MVSRDTIFQARSFSPVNYFDDLGNQSDLLFFLHIYRDYTVGFSCRIRSRPNLTSVLSFAFWNLHRNFAYRSHGRELWRFLGASWLGDGSHVWRRSILRWPHSRTIRRWYTFLTISDLQFDLGQVPGVAACASGQLCEQPVSMVAKVDMCKEFMTFDEQKGMNYWPWCIFLSLASHASFNWSMCLVPLVRPCLPFLTG